MWPLRGTLCNAEAAPADALLTVLRRPALRVVVVVAVAAVAFRCSTRFAPEDVADGTGYSTSASRYLDRAFRRRSRALVRLSGRGNRPVMTLLRAGGSRRISGCVLGGMVSGTAIGVGRRCRRGRRRSRVARRSVGIAVAAIGMAAPVYWVVRWRRRARSSPERRAGRAPADQQAEHLRRLTKRPVGVAASRAAVACSARRSGRDRDVADDARVAAWTPRRDSCTLAAWA